MKRLQAAFDNKNHSIMKAQVEKLFQEMQHKCTELKNSKTTLEKVTISFNHHNEENDGFSCQKNVFVNN